MYPRSICNVIEHTLHAHCHIKNNNVDFLRSAAGYLLICILAAVYPHVISSNVISM